MRSGRLAPGQTRTKRALAVPTPPVWSVATAVLSVLGLSLVALGFTSAQRPPGPVHALGRVVAPGLEAAAPVGPAPLLPTTPATTSTTVVTGPANPLAASVPLRLTIPAIGVRSGLLSLGLNPDRTIQVPDTINEAGWYRLGPTPGQEGPAVIIGHVDSFAGPGVFYRLGALKPGDTVLVTRADGITATFRVSGVDEYLKSRFPTQTVYGQIPYPGLRLITCGGTFDSSTHSYRSNIVVFAYLVSP